jgi:hypothetical protein
MQASAVIASVVYQGSNRSERLPRREAPKATTTSARTNGGTDSIRTGPLPKRLRDIADAQDIVTSTSQVKYLPWPDVHFGKGSAWRATRCGDRVSEKHQRDSEERRHDHVSSFRVCGKENAMARDYVEHLESYPIWLFNSLIRGKIHVDLVDNAVH